MGKQKSKRSSRSKHALRKSLQLKGHHGEHRQNPLDLLENTVEDVVLEDPNLELLPKKSCVSTAIPNTKGRNEAQGRKLSKAELRKKKQVEGRKEQRETLSSLFETLKKHDLSDQQRNLLKATKDMGMRVSRKQELQKHLQLQKMGLPLPQGSRLYQKTSDFKQDSEMEVEKSDEEKDLPQVQVDGNEIYLEQIEKDCQAIECGEKRQREDIIDLSERQIAKKIRKQLRIEQSQEQQQQCKDGLGCERNGEIRLPHRVVYFDRDADLDEKRKQLPVCQMEQEIMEMIQYNDICVISGETGSGKTTQVPQFLLEAGYGNQSYQERSGTIGVTQPRRVAAVAAAERVSVELNTTLGEKLVGYQVRYDRKVGENVALKFMTDGILLREMQEDFLLRKYSVLIVDEAHERSLCSDILLGMLSRCIPLRRRIKQPLKLIIMSATLRVQDFSENPQLFSPAPPIINVDVRQYPVFVHFNRRTEMGDYVAAAYKKTCRIHRELPQGGILVFVTGQREVNYLVRRLNATFNRRKHRRILETRKGGKDEEDEDVSSSEDDEESDKDALTGADHAETQQVEEEGRLQFEKGQGVDDDYDSDEQEEEEEDQVEILGAENWTEEQLKAAEEEMNQAMNRLYQGDESYKEENENEEEEEEEGLVHVLPLYAMLAKSKQELVFKATPPRRRLIVVATNVAETSLTIPGIRYVVDAGRSKQKILENSSGMARYEVRWISKASAAQRSGRAGRTGPGHCYRICSSAHYNNSFPEYTFPEIINTPLEGVVLMMKSMRVPVRGFVFPTQPPLDALQASEKSLKAIGAIENKKNGVITDIGGRMSKLPIGPRHSRMLVETVTIVQELQHSQTEQSSLKPQKSLKLLLYAIMLAACLSLESPFVHIETIQTSKPVNSQGREENDIDESKNSEEKLVTEKQSTKDGDMEVLPKQTKKEIKDQQRKIRQAARQIHDQFRSSDSDALSALNALIAFQMHGQTEEFCRDNYLHFRILKEMSALSKQLLRITKQNWSGYIDVEELSTDTIVTAPSNKIVKQLKRALAAGWSDQVCRRMRSEEYLNQLQEEGRYKAHAVRYQHCCLEEKGEVYLHPRSALHRSAPEFVVYTELLQTDKRIYMAGVSSIFGTALSQLHTPLIQESQLKDPAPYFCTKVDQAMAYYSVSYGIHAWPLPIVAKAMQFCETSVAVFSVALLTGQVWNHWTPYLQGMLMGDVGIIARSEGKVLQRVNELLHRLMRNGVASKKVLQNKWRRDPNFLRAELEMWIKESQIKEFRKIVQQLISRSLTE